MVGLSSATRMRTRRRRSSLIVWRVTRAVLDATADFAAPPRTLALPTPAALAYWGNAPPDGHAQITWHEQAGLKLSFNPRAVGPTPRQLDPPGSGAAATLVLVLPDGARCTPETETRSTLTVDGTSPTPGAVVTGSVTAEKLRCNIGPPADVQGKFRVVVTDLR